MILFPSAFRPPAKLTAPVVFAGYGASADEFGYDDYAGIDVQGQDRRPAALRAARLRREKRQPGTHAARRR